MDPREKVSDARGNGKIEKKQVGRIKTNRGDTGNGIGHGLTKRAGLTSRTRHLNGERKKKKGGTA